jgi:hypothetical protein
MGAYYMFTCPECGYKAEVSGGKDRGMRASVQTMTCTDCSILVDVQVGHYERSIVKGRENFITENGKCPECFGTNLKKWEKDGRCPTCIGVMEQREMVALWD